MEGICFEAIEQVSVRTLSDPIIETPTDAIVKVNVAGLCGSDLHPFFGREVGLDAGTVMGHEFVGEVTEVGSDVAGITIGDRVCAPFTTNCGQCFYCKRGLTSRCPSGKLFGWRTNGIGLHGGQSQFVRVPLADATLMRVPDAMESDVALLLGDNLSTGYFCADMAGVTPEGVFVVIGCGTVGLLAAASALSMSAENVIAIDPVEPRTEMARKIGATAFSDPSEALDHVLSISNGRGADAVMELVGLPDAQKLAIDLVRPGGTLSVIGCHCSPNFAFSPADAYDKNLVYRTGRCPARHYMPILAKQLARSPIDLSWCITHRFDIQEASRAYDTFANRKENCIKAVIDFD